MTQNTEGEVLPFPIWLCIIIYIAASTVATIGLGLALKIIYKLLLFGWSLA